MGKCSVAVRLVHARVKIDALGVVGDSLIVVFAFYGFIPLHSLLLGSVFLFLFIELIIVIIKILLKIFKVGLGWSHCFLVLLLPYLFFPCVELIEDFSLDFLGDVIVEGDASA